MASLWPTVCKRRIILRGAAAGAVGLFLYTGANPMLNIPGIPVYILSTLQTVLILLPLLIAALSPTLTAVLLLLVTLASPSALGLPLQDIIILSGILLLLDGALFRCEEAKWKGETRLSCKLPGCWAIPHIMEIAVGVLIVLAAYTLSSVPTIIIRLYRALGESLPPDTAGAWQLFTDTPIVQAVIFAFALGILSWFMLTIFGWLRIMLVGTREDAEDLLARIRRDIAARIGGAKEWYHRLYHLAALYILAVPSQLAWAVILSMSNRRMTAGELLVFWILELLLFYLIGYRLTRGIPRHDSMTIYKYSFIVMIVSLAPLVYEGLLTPESVLGTLRAALEGAPPPSPEGRVLGEDIARLVEYIMRVLLS